MQEERSRVTAERAAKEQRERTEAAERESRIRIRLEEEALRTARERDRMLEEERRRAEEQARLEGIRVAEIARARDEVARKAAHESAMLERDHAQKLAAIRHTASARAARTALAGTSIAVLVACTALAWRELGVHPERLATLRTESAGATANERARAERAEVLLERSESSRRELEAKLRERSVAPAAPATVVPTDRTSPPRSLRRPASKPGKPAPCENDGDPLNPCLSR